MTFVVANIGRLAECCQPDPPFRWDEERRFLLRCELDAAFLPLYLGAETEWCQQPAALTQAFPTFQDEKKWGDYRTQRVILEIYDALTEAIQTGKPHQTRLDPPPAHARCCHPAKEPRSI